MTCSDRELDLQLPASTKGHLNTLVTGLGVFAGLWACMIALFLWLLPTDITFIIIFGGLLFIMLMSLVFLYFGVSHCKIDQDKLKIRHTLFGIPINWSNTNRQDLSGFSTIFLGVIPKEKGSHSKYFVVGKTKKLSNVFIGASTLNQNEARRLAKELNEFLGLGTS